MGDYKTFTGQVSHILRSKSKSVVDKSKTLQPKSLPRPKCMLFPSCQGVFTSFKGSCACLKGLVSFFYNSYIKITF